MFKKLISAGCLNSLKIQLTGGSGDADLYVRFGEQPTDSEFD